MEQYLNRTVVAKIFKFLLELGLFFSILFKHFPKLVFFINELPK